MNKMIVFYTGGEKMSEVFEVLEMFYIFLVVMSIYIGVCIYQNSQNCEFLKIRVFNYK